MMTDEPNVQGKNSVAPARPGARWGQERRLEFIDYRLRWDGQINRSDLTDFFGISVPQASIDLSEYARLASHNLEYDNRTRVYKSTPAFTPVFASSALERYLDDLLRIAIQPDIPYGSFLGWHAPVATVPRPGRRLDAETVGLVLRAIRQKHALFVTYRSLSTPEPTDRKLTPHALVQDGARWHFRAFCHTKHEFRDFSLSRVVTARDAGPDEDRASEDSQWHTIVNLVIGANPRLKPYQKKVIEWDYAMQDGEITLQCRQALTFYLLYQLNLQEERPENSPLRQQLTLKNRKKIEHLLPPMS
ncbi:YafY family protein [Pseudomonas sp. 008]|uniref:helix-turn-helix transcriptional regulator n=1 Tax=Pseudomonas sp. 008 TaxID=2803906 RepID=UPI001A55BDC4|nr:WYL domain-containing protein [Pseudomonas sp. 008]GID03016.1 hypothetical protein TMM008_02180 [Pseudomonas sp. 008]